jgi:hypothetical protein
MSAEKVEKTGIGNMIADMEEEKRFSRKLFGDTTFSSTLLQDRNAQLDFAQEARLYKARMVRSPEERKLIGIFSQQILLSPHVETITAMPAYIGEDDLQKSLLAYAAQEGELDSHHIVLFLNSGNQIEGKHFEELLRKRQTQVQEVMAKVRGLAITTITHQFPEKVVLGRVRGLMADAIITAAQTANLKDPILVSNDADQLTLAHSYLATIREAYRTNKKLDAAAGPIYRGGYGPEGKNYMGTPELPELYLGALFIESSDAVVEHGEGGTKSDFYTSGPNFSVRLAALCAMGSYDYSLGFKEEVEIGRRAKAMRIQDGDQVFYHSEHFRNLENAYVVTSPRRALPPVLNNKTLIEQWERFDDVVGSDCNLTELSQRYLSKTELLQMRDIIEATEGKEAALDKMHGRIKEIFLRSANYDGISTPERLAAVAKRFGLSITEVCWDAAMIQDILIDWGTSAITDKLYSLGV